MHNTRTTIYMIGILCALAFWLPLSSVAQSNFSQIQLKNLSVADGLSQVSVTGIVEDKYGFIWLSTMDGLNRFDGYDFTQFHHKQDDPNSLPDQFVRLLFVDKKQRLWVATHNGLALYNYEKNTFTNFLTENSGLKSNIVLTISDSFDGKLLVSDEQSLYEYDEQKMDFVEISLAGESLPTEIREIYSENEKTWVGTNGKGIFILNNADNVVYDLSQSNPWNIQIADKYVFDIEKIQNQIWLATEKGVYAYSPDGKLMSYFSGTGENKIVGGAVRSIQQSSDGSIWLGTELGISIVDPQTNKVFSIDSTNEKSVGLKNRAVFALYEDSKQTMWIGTHTKGVHLYNNKLTQIKHFTSQEQNENSLSNDMVWSLNEDSAKLIWIGTQTGGVNSFDPETGSFKRYLGDFEHNIFDLAIDEKDQIWLGTTNGLYTYKPDNFSLQPVSHLLPETGIFNIKYLGDKIWVTTDKGQLAAVSTDDFSIQLIDPPNRKVTSLTPLFIDSNENLWITNNLGLAYYDFAAKQFNQLIIESISEQSFIVEVFEVGSSIWVVTSEDGIFQLDPSNYTVQREFRNLEELNDTRIVSATVLDDSIWLASLRAIYEIDITSKQVVFTIGGEMLDNNNLAEGSVLTTSGNQLLFGGAEGFHIFDPYSLKAKGTPLSIAPVIKGLSIYNEPVTRIGPDSPLRKPVYLSEEITLNNNHSPFSLSFAQINPINPLAYEYRYKIEGLNDNWLSADPRTRQATFTNLLFGGYDFYVQSRYLDGPWSPSAHIKIKVSPPIWLHRNAIVLYGFFLFLLLAYWFKQFKTKRANQLAIQESEERLKLTLWSSGDELWDWDIYRGQVFRANTWGTLDFPQDNIRANSSYQANIHADDIPKVQKALNQHMQEDTDHFQVTYRARTFKGDWIWLLDRGKVVRRDNNNQPIRMTGTLKNISHLKQAEEQLKLFKRSIETISDGVFIADTTFRYISVNQSYCKYTGETREQALASYLTFHQYPDAFTDEVKKSLQQKGNWLGEVESRRSNGEKYEMELNIDAVQGEDGKISHYVGVFSDITSRKSTEKELLKLANTDPLTEMPNRSFFQASHGNLVRKNAPHALLCMDMDNFKKINDSLGHQTGDILIKQIGKRLQKISGISSTCYRLGGDEFSILIDNTTDMHRITHFAQHILDDMTRPFLINKQEFVLSASVGIAFFPEDGNTPQELLKNADTAMYFAKNSGGNKYQFFSGEMNQNAVRQLQIENLIRHGLKEDLFTVFYQPKVDIATGKLVSMEALVRFEHPEKGIVSPSQFIPLAEETGQIVEIGERVMQKACEDTKRWVAQGLFTGRVAVNIAARQFELPDLDDRIDKILQKVGLSALHLECEITEGTLMENPDQALRMMERLRERGIHLALDDFGTGYSSLAYLKKFPLNTLKIDKAFIDDIATSNVDKHMTAAIINIAHNLGLKVVAEGVEQEKQLAILRRYECEMLQGYLYSKPLNAVRFERLLKENLQLTQLMNQPT